MKKFIYELNQSILSINQSIEARISYVDMKKLSIELLSNNTNIIIFNVSVKNKKHNPSWPEIPDHQYIIFTIGGSSSGKTNALQ